MLAGKGDNVHWSRAPWGVELGASLVPKLFANLFRPIVVDPPFICNLRDVLDGFPTSNERTGFPTGRSQRIQLFPWGSRSTALQSLKTFVFASTTATLFSGYA